MKYSFSVIGLIFSTILSGQSEAVLSFEQLLKSAQVYYAEPLETFFKKDRIEENSVIQFNHALKAKKDPVDIRYKIIPIDESNLERFAPQVKISSMAMHMATNDELDSDMVFHQLDDASLKPYNADFGLTVFFKPKDKITSRTHCKATFLYAEGKGIICTFLFFDKTDIDLKLYEQNLGFTAGEM